MKKALHYGFISCYAAGGAWTLLQFASYFQPVPLQGVLPVIWVLISFSGYYWLPWLFMQSLRVRRTVLEEEEWLHPIMHELNLRTSLEPAPQLLIMEQPEMIAFATGRNTIVLSRGLMVTLNEYEIKAVLAHEYGHLKNRDTMTSSAMILASYPFLAIHLVSVLLFSRKANWLRNHKWKSKLLLVSLGVFGVILYPDIVILLLFFFIFKKLFPVLQLLIVGIVCWFTRSSQFRQDRFAHRLGCGRHLKSALLKISRLDSPALVNGISQLWMPHPMLHQRIRRLEWLEGQRPRP